MRLCCVIIISLLAVVVNAQPTMVLSRDVASLQVMKNGEPTFAPVLKMNSGDFVAIDFDVMGHEYRRVVYKVEHWDAEWNERSDLMESEYMEGFDGNPIEDYEESMATAVLYTHYSLCLPNDDVSLRLSGNYRVWLIDEERGDTLAVAGFMLQEGGATAAGLVTGRTDMDINGRHQQMELEVGFGALGVADPERELKVFVQQNRRWDTRVRLTEPNVRSGSKVGWTHRRELIFDAGNACHKFETLGKHVAGFGVDRIEYVAPYEHVVLFPVTRMNNYDHDTDLGGVFVIRNVRGDANTEGEYRWVHFALDIDRLPADERVFVVGDLTQGQLRDDYELIWNDQAGVYECSALLKEGYYEYRIVHTDNKPGRARTWLTDGDFWETHNDYHVSVYWRERGARYDRLVGIFKLETR